MRSDLMALLGHRVTVTNPNNSTSWTGTLIAVTDGPSVIIDQDTGPRMTLPQRFTITTADDTRPTPATWDQYIAKDGDLLPHLQAAQRTLQQESLLDRLGNMTANLSEYIDQRAQELAQPLIDEARETAAIEVKGAQGMQQRAEDLNTELRRQLRPLQRQVDAYHQRAKAAEAAVERMRKLIDSYPPGSDFVQCGAAQLFRDHLNGTKG